MRKTLSSVVVGIAAVGLLFTTVVAASAATTTAGSSCPAIDAPKGMNDIPASDDCPTPGALHANVTPAASGVTATTPISMTPLAFDRTNGDILAITKVSGTNDIAFGGNFTLVYTPDGVSHPAVNFVVVDETSGALQYAGNPTNSVTASDNYVRAITSLNGVIYVGGDFNGWDGAARTQVAMLSPSGNAAPAAWAVTSAWHPAPSGDIRALAVDSNAVYMAGDAGVLTAVNPTTGAVIWAHGTTGGSIHGLLEDQGALFVAGLFETYNGYTQHGLVKVSLTDGSVITAFNAHLRADDGVGADGDFDGEDALSLAVGPNSSTQLCVGIGGHAPKAGLVSNESILLDITTGARTWSYTTYGDSQGIGSVGDTVVAGYHNNSSTSGNPLTPNYFSIQLEASSGKATTWDPQINGNQSNADGGNNGVQAIYVDPVNDILFLAGAFEHWDGTTGLTHASLIAFSYTPSSATVPGSPTGVTAAAGNGNAQVSWTAPVSNGGGVISSYTVESSPGGFTATAPTATPVTVSGLTNGTAYTFTVTATNAIGTSAPSTASAAVTPASGGGSSNTAEGGTAGTTVTVANSGGGSGNAFGAVNKGTGTALVYSAAATAHGLLGYAFTGASGTAVDLGWTGYNATSMATRFYYNPGPTLPSTQLRLADIRNASGSALRVVLSATNQLVIQNAAATNVITFAHTLQANTWYRIEVATSVSSTVATINAAYYPLDSSTPVDPAYSTTTGNTGTANITQVLIGSNASSTWTGTSYLDDLAVQPSSTSFIGVYVPPGSTAPGAPTNASAVPGDGQATVSWVAPVSNGGTAVTGYTVTSSPGNFTAPAGANGTSAVVTGLTDGTAYTFTVTATNLVGTGSPSVASTPVTPAAAPGAPTGVGAVPGDGQATVSWVAPASNGGSAITGYTVTSSPGGLTASTAGATSAVVMGLTDNTAYTFKVTATNAIGTGPASSPSPAVTPAGVPAAPTAVSASPGNTQATVTWTAPSNGGSAITNYTVTSSPGGFFANSASTSATVTGLTNGTAYTFMVTATNGVGTGPSSAPSAAVTPLSAAVKSNSAEGGTSGTSVTAANSGGASGTAFTVFTKGSGAAVVYSTAADAHGVLGYAVTGASGTATSMGWNGYSAPSIALRFYYNPGPTLPSSVMRLADIRNASGTAVRVELSAANQLFIQNFAGSTVTTFAHALQANTWYRIELAMSVSSSAATINAAYYLLDSTTPVDPAYSTATGNTGTANVTQVTIGSTASATWTKTSYFDDVATQTPSTSFIGPLTAAPTAPGAPTTVSATPGDGQATVSWSAPTSNGGSAITGYTVTSSPGNKTATTTGATSAIVSGLTDGTSYTFTVTATNSVGTGPASSPSTPVTPVAAVTAPGAPIGVNATPGDGQATVSWSAPTSNGGSAITGYTVTSSPGNKTATTTGATSAIVSGLTDGQAYTFTVTATNSVGTGPASSPSTSVTPVAAVTAPGAPIGVNATPGDGQATVSWSAPTSNGGSAITGYTVTSSPGGLVGSSAGAATTATVTGLTDGQAYTFTVTATNSFGTGPASSPSTSVTPVAAATVPGAPLNVTAVAGDGQATVSWDAPTSDGGSTITGYTVTSTPGGFHGTTAGDTSASVIGLADGTAYTFTVVASNAIGDGAPSDPSTAVTPAAPMAPDAPTNVTADPGDGQATVSWTVPADNGSAITSYTVTTSPADVAPMSASGTPTVITGLVDGKSYTFTVTATNSIGTSLSSDPSTAVTPNATAATAPGAPTSVSAVAGDGQATVSWVAPASNGGSSITGYTVTTSPPDVAPMPATGSPAVVTGLTDGQAYTFTVIATNGVGPGPASNPSSPVTPTVAVTVPSAPLNVAAVTGNAQATVSWNVPASNGGSAIIQYMVTSSPAGGTASTAGATSALVMGLTNGVSYTFTVTAANSAGTGPPSAPSNSVTPTGGTLVSNSAEGGTSGTSVTVSNSGGASGNAFTVANKGSGASLIFSTAAADHGALGYSLTGASGNSTFMGWNGYTAPSMAIRFYYNPGLTLPSSVIRLADIRNASATAARVELSASNQLFIQNSAGSTVTTFPHALQANTWYRIELTISVSSSAASINAAYYAGNSTTPVDPAYSATTGNTGTANITQVSIGSAATATWTGTSFFDDLAAQSGTTAFIGS
jgi:hypothetical protein